MENMQKNEADILSDIWIKEMADFELTPDDMLDVLKMARDKVQIKRGTKNIDTMEIPFTIVNTEKITKGKWVAVVNTSLPMKTEVRIAAENEVKAFHKTMAFFQDERSPLTKVANDKGGFTYTLPDKK